MLNEKIAISYARVILTIFRMWEFDRFGKRIRSFPKASSAVLLDKLLDRLS